MLFLMQLWMNSKLIFKSALKMSIVFDISFPEYRKIFSYIRRMFSYIEKVFCIK